MEEQKGYRIMMNEKQALVVAEALEFYSRFMSGQLDHLPPALQGYMIKTKGVPSSHFDPSIQKPLTDLQRMLFPDLNGLNNSYGVGSEHIPETSLAYEIYKMIRYTREMENPSDSWNVDQREPMKYSGEPLIDVEPINFTKEMRDKNLDNLLNDEE